jgi:hypothetical protein
VAGDGYVDTYTPSSGHNNAAQLDRAGGCGLRWPATASDQTAVCMAIAQPEYPAQRNALVDEGAFMRELSWKAK